ncbi:peptidase family C50-domain-containing protein [Myxozyma melibiosi]|uniref:separase n=1 Tax=Myxozyma melibiosi TaxID=54550 RepID=A0ABR1F8P8_9ASCO
MVQTKIVRPSQLGEPGFGLGTYNKAVHYVGHTKTVLESQKLLTSLDEFLSHILLKEPPIESQFERLLVDLDLLRRTAYKMLGDGSKELVFGLLSFVIHYREQDKFPMFHKVAVRILENCIALLKPLLQNVQDKSLSLYLNKCSDVCNIIGDTKYTTFIANAYFNYGIALWKISRKEEASAAWSRYIKLQSSALADSDISVFAKKIERIAIASMELKQYSKAAALLIEATTKTFALDASRIGDMSNSESIGTIITRLKDSEHLLMTLANCLGHIGDVSVINLDFPEISMPCRGVVMEWLTRILISSRKKSRSCEVSDILVRKLTRLYRDQYPIRMARSILLNFSSSISRDQKKESLLLLKTAIERLNAGPYNADARLVRFKDDMVASLSLYHSILEYQLLNPECPLLSNSVALWSRLINSANMDKAIMEKQILLANLNILCDFLSIRGETTSLILILHCMRKVDVVNSQLMWKCCIQLSRLYLRLGLTGQSSELLQTAYSLINGFEASTDQQTSLYLADIDYLISIGNLERASSRMLLIREYMCEKKCSSLSVNAQIFLSISRLLKELGRYQESIGYAKTGIKLLNQSIHSLRLSSNESANSPDTAPFGSCATWPLVSQLLENHEQLFRVYDAIGMVRETEFYMSETTKLARSVQSAIHAEFYELLQADFLTRSGNIQKAEPILLAAMSSSNLRENHLHSILVKYYLLRYFRRIGNDESASEMHDAILDLIYATTGDNNVDTQHSSDLEGMFTRLSLQSSEGSGTRQRKDSIDNHFGLRRLEANILRAHAIQLLSDNNWSEAKESLDQASRYSGILLGDRAMQSALESQFHLQVFESQLRSDPVFGVLQDSALSIPNIVPPSGGKKTSTPAVTRGRRAKSTVSSKGLQDAHKALQQSRQLVLDSFVHASKVCSAFERRVIANQAGKILLLQSATEPPDSSTPACASNFFFELSRGLSIQRDASAVDASLYPSPELLQPDSTLDSVLDLNAFQQEYVNSIPDNWVAVSVSLSEESGDLIVSRFQANESPFLLRLPLNRHCSRDADEDSFSFADAKAELHEIITKSNATAKASRELHEKGKVLKQQWWSERRELDQRLEELLTNMEYCWLGGFRGILSGLKCNSELSSRFYNSFMSILTKHLPTRRSARTRQSTAKNRATDVKIDPRVLELFLGLGDPNIAENAELLEDLIYFTLDILQFHGEYNAYDELDMDQITVDIQEIIRSYYESLHDEDDRVEHLVLILDQTVQMFPWESLPCLRKTSVSRVPSLTKTGGYILNPSADLRNTESLFSQRLKELPEWEGVTGRAPDEAEFKRLLETKDLVLYFGHGGGEQYIRSSQVKNLECCSAAFLMGCSSGLLHDSGDFEPWGTPANYLIGGCPTLVANLWDVTDKDIDKFSDAMFQSWGLYGENSDISSELGERGNLHLGEAVAKSRDSCILKYLNGAAPVIYGLPLALA